ncbi:MAG TPA: hypothetical protein VHS74_14435, partial [Solirubrobacterales bacterium]|nr:hypothetical protein [Solirubrobacterales bacterium]
MAIGRRTRRIARASCLGVLAVVLLAVAAAPASAAVGHSLLRTFSTGPGTVPQPLATDSDGNVYVIDGEGNRIEKFDSAGNPVPFSASAKYIDGNALLGTPAGEFELNSGVNTGIAVVGSAGPTHGYIYVAAENLFGGAVVVYDASGSYKGRLAGTPNGICGVAVNPANGAVYASKYYTVTRYPASTDPANASPDGVLTNGSCAIAVDPAGAVYVGNTLVQKYEPSQFGAETPVAAATFPMPSFYGARAVAVFPGGGELYFGDNNQIHATDSALVEQGAPFARLSGESRGLATDAAADVLATDPGGGVFVYGPTEVELPLATTGGSANVGTQTADVAGSVDPDSAGGIVACEFRYGPDTGYSEGAVPCTPSASGGSPITAPEAVTAHLSGLVSGTTYHYRLF